MTASEGRLGQRIIRSGSWVAISTAGKALLQLGRSAALARLLSPEAFGLMGLAQVIIRGLELFSETGIGPALIHRQERIEEATQTAFVVQALRGVALASCALVVAPFAAIFYQEPRLRDIMIALASVLLIYGFSNIRLIVLQKQLDFRRLAPFELAVAALSTASTIALAWVLRDVWALVIGQVINAVLTVALSYYVAPGAIRFGFDREMARELLKYGKYITGLTIVMFFTSEIDNLIIGKALGFAELGVYSIAFMLANLPATHIAKVAAVVLFPAYSTLQHDLAKVRTAYLTALRGIGGLTIPASVGLAVLAPEIVRIGFGERWSAAIEPLRILALLGISRSINVVGGYLYNALGRPYLFMYQASIKLAIIAVILYPVTIRYGLIGAACAIALPQFIVDILSIKVVRSQTGVSLTAVAGVLMRIALRTTAMIAVVVLVRLWLYPIGVVDLIGLTCLGALVYVAVSFSEIRELQRMLKGGKPASIAQAAAPQQPDAVV
jgi:O-antigen/teichoic acid export membrane protein